MLETAVLHCDRRLLGMMLTQLLEPDTNQKGWIHKHVSSLWKALLCYHLHMSSDLLDDRRYEELFFWQIHTVLLLSRRIWTLAWNNQQTQKEMPQEFVFFFFFFF